MEGNIVGKEFSLASYQEVADKTYGSFRVKVSDRTFATLRNPMRLDDAANSKVLELVDQIVALTGDGEDEDKEMTTDDVKALKPLLSEFLLTVGDANTKKLLEAIAGDFVVLMAVFQDYFKEIALGEASPSEG
jgi:hypothetical protein